MSPHSQIEVFPDKADLIYRAVEVVLTEAHKALSHRDRFTIALAGGSTPEPLYQALAKQELPWDKVHVFWGDERYVPATDPQSNEGMARRAWLNHVPIPASNIHSIPTSAADPSEAAQQHEQELQSFFGTPSGEFPALDLILLGIGDDGHTASLFPGTPALDVTDRLVTVGSKDGQPRITFTHPLINQARLVLFLVTGASKLPALKAILSSKEDARQYPARLIQPTGSLVWLLDEAAGSGLNLG
ncbi:6-phosphogluconolactonase [Leptolyngbya sp. FACHB-261]|uniref:6-phosphogluconolactonase n=1 Tax=Leptolyngbya sp. FACHB-261 TaxID=2692806 RepID=UPI001684EBEB|nr:6-phosphogluconolactonase [Leptolyngbya sp. FACHB-261]MBD2104598.1 6-phosphogluconolactonase [Leptolyngbya sp. FACHB-261]